MSDRGSHSWQPCAILLVGSDILYILHGEVSFGASNACYVQRLFHIGWRRAIRSSTISICFAAFKRFICPSREDAYIIDLQSCQYGYNAKGTVLNIHDRVIDSRGPEKARRA